MPNEVRTRALPRDLTDRDRKIIEILRADARTPNNAIAARVGIAPSTCLARVKALEESGAIRGYHAEVDLEAWGTPLQAMIAVRVRAGARSRLRDFVEHVRTLPEVLDVYFLAGNDDFLIHSATADAAHLRDFVLDELSEHPEVAGTQTHLVFDHARGAGRSSATSQR